MSLFVEDLDHSVTEEELKQRFEPFGKVASVQLLTKRDETGLVIRGVSAFINIDINDVNLKKCMSVYNKARWKGEQQIPHSGNTMYYHNDSSVPQYADMEKCSDVENVKLLDASFDFRVCQHPTSKQVPKGQQVTKLPNHSERFYAVNSDLKSLLRSNEECTHFTFLQSENNDHDSLKKQSCFFAKSKFSVNENILEPHKQQDTTVQSHASSAHFCLFFHSSNPQLSNRLNEYSFFRSHDLSQIEQKWRAQKPKMKECCRQRWKDAIRRMKKLNKFKN